MRSLARIRGYADVRYVGLRKRCRGPLCTIVSQQKACLAAGCAPRLCRCLPQHGQATECLRLCDEFAFFLSQGVGDLKLRCSASGFGR